jgi:hypothetical protein
MRTNDTLRGFGIIVAIAAVATLVGTVSSAIFSEILGAISLVFICLLWYFGYGWYHRNRMAISLMPDRQRSILYLGLGAVTVAAALYSLGKFGLLDLGAFTVPVVAVGLGGAFAMYYGWNESKRYYL